MKALRDGDLRLRAWVPADLPELVAAANDPEIGRWMPAIPYPYLRADGEAYLRRYWLVIIGALSAHNIHVSMQSGGLALNEERIRAAKEAGLRSCGVSIDGSPELHDKLRGMNISIVTTARNDEQARALLKGFGMPFRT